MPENKNQHFVPRAYLRNFSASDGRKEICLYNIRRDIFVNRAPIKNQCSKDYFYGTDDLEHALAEIEAKYAQVVSRGLLLNPPIIVEGLADFLRLFMMIQMVRTEANVLKRRAFFQMMDAMVDLPPDHPLMKDWVEPTSVEHARDSILFADQARESISDLGITFVCNKSQKRFITSDDPVLFTNRLYTQRMKEGNFGIGNAGAIFYLPLSPNMAAVLYDADVYSLPKRGIVTTLNSSADVEILNLLVFQNARENLYMVSKGDFSPGQAVEWKSSRLDKWGRSRVAAKVREDDTGTYFEEVDETPAEGGYLMIMSQDHPRPLSWPKILRFRQDARAYSNDSGAGLVRRGSTRDDAGPYYRVRV